MSKQSVGVWVGLRKCGCCVAVVVDQPDHQKDVNKSKRDLLRDGLSVVYGTWDEWQTKYLPSMQRDCEHQKTAHVSRVALSAPQTQQEGNS